MGRRLFERGMKNVFLPDALVHYDHQISIEERRKAWIDGYRRVEKQLRT